MCVVDKCVDCADDYTHCNKCAGDIYVLNNDKNNCVLKSTAQSTASDHFTYSLPLPSKDDIDDDPGVNNMGSAGGKKSKSIIWIVVACVAAVIVLSVIIIIVVVIKRRNKGKDEENEDSKDLSASELALSANTDNSIDDEFINPLREAEPVNDPFDRRFEEDTL